MSINLESWSSHVDVIRLRKPLEVKIRASVLGYDIFCRSPQLVGSGETIERALQMLFDHMMIDYYEYSLNPGLQSPDDVCYGRRLKAFFNSEKPGSGGSGVPKINVDKEPDL